MYEPVGFYMNANTGCAVLVRVGSDHDCQLLGRDQCTRMSTSEIEGGDRPQKAVTSLFFNAALICVSELVFAKTDAKRDPLQAPKDHSGASVDCINRTYCLDHVVYT